jgi:hypothetical protein
MPVLSDLPNLDGQILYLDIGGSAIKSAILPCHGASGIFTYLADTPNATVTRTEWNPDEYGETVSQIVRRLVSESGNVRRIAISIGGSEVSSNGREYKGWMTRKGRVESNLADALERELGLMRGSVSILNDSYAWGRGVRSWIHQSGRSLADGIGLLVVGTGVAFTVLTDTGVEIRHIHDWNRYDWSDLARFANFSHGDWIHQHLGADYFRWRDNEHQTEDARREETNRRYQLLLNQLSKAHNLSRFLIGGGCAPRFEGCNFTQQVSTLACGDVGFDPGFLPLIGLAS